MEDWEEEQAVKACYMDFFVMKEEDIDIDSVRKLIVEEQRKNAKLLETIQSLDTVPVSAPSTLNRTPKNQKMIYSMLQ